MTAVFEILQKDAAGRIGRLHTPHGVVETPTVMPVINPNINTIPSSEMHQFGAQILITNSYIISRKDKLRNVALEKGLHHLLDFDGPIMTDSGSFQLSVYGDVEVTNEQIIKFQKNIGSDIAVPLDIPTPPDVSYKRAEGELETTLERVIAAKEIVTDNMLLAGPVQGSTHPNLRVHSAKTLSKHSFDVYPIGAVVPLMESYRYADLVDVVISSKKGLDPVKPVHLFGAGHPMMFALAVAMGCDLFDSAAYALYAKAGRYITVAGTSHLKDLQYLPCNCPVCSAHTASEIKSASNSKELLARHNLYVTFAEIRNIKQAIREGNLLELVEQRCRSHPSMLSALKRLYNYSPWLERLDPFSKSTFFYTGPESSKRPEVARFEERLGRFNLDGKILIRSKSVKGEGNYDHVLNFKPPFGAYPVELSEVYPFNAEIPDEMDPGAIGVALQNVIGLINKNRNGLFYLTLPKQYTVHPTYEDLKKNAIPLDEMPNENL
jgi:7-cyano-7-deazaguanine tRNA-ribosyltransferase